MLNINIRVNSAAANSQIRTLRSSLSSLNSAAGSAGASAGRLNSLGSMPGLERFGKNLQWTGRQLEFAFTLPLVLAGTAATKFALANETAMVGVRKVYGSLEEDAGQLNAELDALARSFELLSTRFGVHQDEVIKIGAAWAQAGAAGVALAKATRLTLEAMIIGEMGATEATEGLLAVQSAYRLNTDELKDALAQLNIIENETSIGLSDLISVVQRAGGAAATAGIDIRHLAAMAAALVPATGTASQAGNALRTIISRIMVPTKDAAEVMEAFGINILDASWQAKNGVQRIESLALAFDGLTQSQKSVASALIASRWQVNRLDVLFRDIILGLDEATKKQSSYAKALDATSNAARYNAIYARELAAVLSSSPRAFAILTNSIRNSLATAILPLLPAMVGVLSHVAQAINWFSKLEPEVQQAALAFLVLLAVIGPLTRYIGSFATLIGLLGSAFGSLVSGIFKVLGIFKVFGKAILVAGWLIREAISGILLALPYVVSGIIGFVSWFGPYLISALSFIASLSVSAFSSVFLSGWAVMQAAWAQLVIVMRVIWLNLVISMQAIWTGFQYAFIAISAGFQFIWLNLTVAMQAIWLATVFAMQRIWVAFQTFLAGFPSFMSMVWTAVIRVTSTALAAMRALMIGFQAFVRVFTMALVSAFTSPWTLLVAAVVVVLIALRKQIAAALRWIVDQFAKLVPALRKIMEKVRDMLSYLNPFARHSPSLVDNVIRGVDTILDQFARLDGIADVIRNATDAFNDFQNATSGGREQTELADMMKDKEDILSVSPMAGPEIDRLISSIFEMKHALSLLGEELNEQKRIADEWEKSLEAAMKPVNDAIFENEIAQKKLRLEILKLEQAGQTVDGFKDKMAALAGEMEMLRSESTELRLAGAGSDILGSYDAQIAALEEQHNALQGMSSPIEDLEKQLKDLQIQGEIMQLERDIEFDPQIKALQEQKDLVSDLEDGYRDMASQISDMEGALRDAAVSARDLKEASEAKDKAKEEDLSFGEELFAAAGEGDFEVPGGDSVPGLGREGGLPEIEDFNAQLEAELNDALKDMGKIDLFKPFRDLWQSTWNWIKENVAPVVTPVWDAVVELWNSFDWGGLGKVAAIDRLWDGWKQSFASLGRIINAFWEDVIQPVFEEIGKVVERAGKIIGGELKNWAPLWDKWIEALGHVWAVTEKVIMAILAVWVMVWPIMRNTVGVVFEVIVDVIKVALELIRGIISVVLNIINGDWKELWGNLLTIVDAIWDAIWLVISTPIKLIWGLIKGFVEAIVNFFQWLYDVLVGNSIIPDMVDAIIAVFQFLVDTVMAIWNVLWTGLKAIWDNVGEPVFKAIMWIIKEVIIPIFKFLLDTVETIWDNLWSAIKWTWSNVGEPVFDGIKWVIDNVLIPAFNGAKEIISRVWNAVAGSIKTAWDNIISPVFDFFKTGIDNLANTLNWFKDEVVDPVWNGIKTIITNVWNGIAAVLEGGINGFIKAFNLLARGINIVTDAINFGPTLSLMDEIKIPRMASGGQVPYKAQGPGGVFNNATAVIGEGSKVFPEYVIPTDPRYRGNAEKLYNSLSMALFAEGGQLGQTGIPHTGDGLGDFLETAINVGKAIVGGGWGILKTFWDLMTKLPGLIRSITQEIPKGVAKFIGDEVIDWAKDLISRGIFKNKDNLGDNPGWQKMWETLQAQFPSAQLFSAVRPDAVTVSGNQSYHAVGRAIDVTPSADIAEWIISTFKGNTKEMIFSPFGNRQIKNGQDFYYTGEVREQHWDHVHWAMKHGGMIPYDGIPSLGRGGIIPATPGGMLIRAGERGRAEEVRPLPRDTEKCEIHNYFYGDLVFPNVTKPDDANKFLRNLQSLAGS